MARGGSAAIQKAIKPGEAPVMSDSSKLWESAFGNSTPSAIGDFASYLVPVAGDARMGYDAISDYANMFGKDLSLKRRLGYGLSGLANTAFSTAGLAATLGGGWGSTAVTAIGRPLVMAMSRLKKGKALADKIRVMKESLKAVRTGEKVLAKGKFYQRPANFFYGSNPYKGWKRFGYGTVRNAVPIGASIAGSVLAAPEEEYN